MVEKNIARLYEVLEIEPYASKDEIKKAYKKLVKKYHPDLYQNKNEKKAAEEKFKLINEAYQYLMNNNVTDSDQRYHSQEDFSEFFTRQVDDDFDDFINEESGDNYENLLKRAIKFVEQEMKSQKIEKLVAFDRISRDKSIFNWDINEYTTSTINDYLIKETLYRRHIRESKEYKGFIKNKKLYSHLNIDAILIVGNKYKKKMFNDNIIVDYKAICSHCCGVGCSKCNQQGVVNKQKKVLVKAPITDEKKFYEIANGGHESILGNGSLLITLVKKNKDIDYELKQKHSVTSAFNPLLNFGDQIGDMLSNFYHLCLTHKHQTLLYFIIICLLIVIICLAVLL